MPQCMLGATDEFHTMLVLISIALYKIQIVSKQLVINRKITKSKMQTELILYSAEISSVLIQYKDVCI